MADGDDSARATRTHSRLSGDDLSDRIRKAHEARRDEAHEAYGADLAAADWSRDAIVGHTIRRRTPGVEPAWLLRAKDRYVELGKFIYALSQAHRMALPPEVMAQAKAAVRAFVDAGPATATVDRLNAMAFLASVELVATRNASVAPPLDAGQPPEEVVCFAYSFYDLEIAVRLAECREDLSALAEALG